MLVLLTITAVYNVNASIVYKILSLLWLFLYICIYVLQFSCQIRDKYFVFYSAVMVGNDYIDQPMLLHNVHLVSLLFKSGVRCLSLRWQTVLSWLQFCGLAKGT